MLLVGKGGRLRMSFREIELTQGKVAVVDEEDFDRLNRYK